MLTEQHQQHNAISRILLLNPAFSADKQQRLRLLNGAAPATEYPPLLTHTPGQPAGLPAAIHTAAATPAEVLLQRIRSGRFSLAGIALLRPLSPAPAGGPGWPTGSVARRHPPAGPAGNKACCTSARTPAVRYTLHWPWLHLPENPLLPWLGDLFDPFDAVSGGLFSIDRKQRTEVLANSAVPVKHQPDTYWHRKPRFPGHPTHSAKQGLIMGMLTGKKHLLLAWPANTPLPTVLPMPFHREGAQNWPLPIRATNLKERVEKWPRNGALISVLPCDVGLPDEEIAAVFTELEKRWGHLDILIPLRRFCPGP